MKHLIKFNESISTQVDEDEKKIIKEALYAFARMTKLYSNRPEYELEQQEEVILEQLLNKFGVNMYHDDVK